MIAPSPTRDRLRLIRTEHRGIGAARAEGLGAARGELIAYCDDDDEWTTGHLNTLVNYLKGLATMGRLSRENQSLKQELRSLRNLPLEDLRIGEREGSEA